MNLSDEEQVKALQREYAQALSHNKEAKELYARVIEENNYSKEEIQVAKPSRPLSTHLEVLRLRKQYQQLQTLSDQIDQAESIAENAHIFETRQPPPAKASVESAETNSQAELVEMLEQAKLLTINLETALLEARYQLKREKALLAAVESREFHTNNDESSTAARFDALLATRAELRSWIESSLAKCETPVPGTSMSASQDEQESLEHIRKEVMDQYDQYIAARQRAIAASSALSQPLPGIPDEEVKSTPRPTLPEKHVRHRSQRSIHDHKQNRDRTHPAPSLSQIESAHLPLHTERMLLNSHTAHLLDEIGQSRSSISETLQRLSDESHLLPAYPILAASTRFQAARSALSRPQTDPTTPGRNTKDSAGLGSAFEIDAEGEGVGKSFHREREAVIEAEISRLLEAWSFASDAAETSTTETIATHVKQGEAGLQQTEEQIQAIEEMNKAWAKLAQMRQDR